MQPTLQPTLRTQTKLWGIKGFRRWFSEEFPKAYTEIDMTSDTEEFDHVLIDMNQILHVALRRRVDEDKSLFAMFRSLDDTLRHARPRRCVVFAFDGPPPAAKLATQRSRRKKSVQSGGTETFGTVWGNRTAGGRGEGGIEPQKNWDVGHSRFVKNDGSGDESLVTLENIVTKGWLAANRRRRDTLRKTEETMVKITPGTAFMNKAAEAVLYYCWQRLCQKRWRGIKFYISGADVPGEGEVKLLDWMQGAGLKARSARAYSLDPRITHNTFVILPDKKIRSYCVSLWETTRSLKAMFPNMDNTRDVINMRTDLVVLMLLNGNDYFPKLRGANFERLFSSYKETVRKLYKEPHSCFLIDPRNLEFNNRFCLEFFSSLAKKAVGNLEEYAESDRHLQESYSVLSDFIGFKGSEDGGGGEEQQALPNVYVDSQRMGHTEMENTLQSDAIVDDGLEQPPQDEPDRREMPLSVLHTLISQKIIPGPYPPKFTFSKKKGKAYLAIGGENGLSDQVVFSVDHHEDLPFISRKKLKQILAGLALDFLIPDWTESPHTVFMRNIQCNAAPHDITEYLTGILWNMDMYQKGVCKDYSYNYGRRRAPSVLDMLHAFQRADSEGTAIGIKVKEFKTKSSRKRPLHSAVSLLCSMPSTESHLIDEYFDPITKDGKIDDVYEECIDKDTGWFDLRVAEAVAEAKGKGETNEELGWPGSALREPWRDKKTGQRINTAVSIGRDYWTVLKMKREHSRPLNGKKPLALTPPQGFCDDMQPLKPNPNIRAHSVKASIQNSNRTSKKERKVIDTRVFGTTLTTAFDHLENKSDTPENCPVDEEGMPTLECLPFKLAYAERVNFESAKQGGGVEGQMYDKDGNKVKPKVKPIEDFVDTQIEQAVSVGKLWYGDKK
ncbi:hypothetical protein TrRE_jg4469, partial [Triparma retinervis]